VIAVGYHRREGAREANTLARGSMFRFDWLDNASSPVGNPGKAWRKGIGHSVRCFAVRPLCAICIGPLMDFQRASLASDAPTCLDMRCATELFRHLSWRVWLHEKCSLVLCLTAPVPYSDPDGHVPRDGESPPSARVHAGHLGVARGGRALCHQRGGWDSLLSVPAFWTHQKTWCCIQSLRIRGGNT
jgi:hypothetical protein